MDFFRLLAMARKEWIQLRRDPRSMILAFVLPLFLLLFFGFAITWDVDDIGLAVLDADRSAESRALVESFVSSGYFTIESHLDCESFGLEASLDGCGDLLVILDHKQLHEPILPEVADSELNNVFGVSYRSAPTW